MVGDPASARAGISIVALDEEGTQHEHVAKAGDDPRTIAARKRRFIMRERLINAVLAVCAEKQHLPFVVDDVIAQAGVSRGTFYKYFDSLEQLITLVGDRLAERFTRQSIIVSEGIRQPILRTAIGLYRLLEQARIDRSWGAFVSRMSLATNDNFIWTFAADEYARGREAGDYSFANIDAVADVTFGAIVSTIRRVSIGGCDRPYIEAAIFHILLSIGGTPSAAREAVAFAASLVSISDKDCLS
ncbi:TetR/AcrR family transcriptional regulator [Sphingobium sp. MK2]|uniref:TetR/AcrR family transcriptional regulator n=1 Tax=Sphingobium sp. MK2 TaxID=3116540 RepID=UPI0032E35A49